MNSAAHLLARFVRRPRLIGAVLLAVVVFAGLVPWMPTARATLIAFDTGAMVFLALMAVLMARATAPTMKRRALIQDEGKWAVLLMSLCLAGVVIGALSSELHAAKVKSPQDIALASSSILLSWLFVATMFSQQYAHSYYVAPDQLVFPGTEHPDYWDFMYFAVVLSMCCQTSDVLVSSGRMRRLVMLHSLVSFFFNVIIIAITVNVVAGVL
jgi:uncharacterized membrane protein